MDFVTILTIFVLACFIGYYVVWSVTPALHTPLMAVTNAISSVIIVGALIAAAAAQSPAAKWLGLAGVVLALRAWRTVGPDARRRAFPVTVALAVTVFPFNTHLAFYSTFWGGLTLMLAALYAGSLLARER